MSAQSPGQRGVLAALGSVVLVLAWALPAGAAPAAHSHAARGQVSQAEVFDPMGLPPASSDSARARRDDHLLGTIDRHPAGARPSPKPAIVSRAALPSRTSVDAGSSTGAPNVRGGAGLLAVASGLGVIHSPAGALVNYDTTGGMVGSRVVYGTYDKVVARAHLPTHSGSLMEWESPSFFKLPNDEFYFPVSASASIDQGRFVVAMPSFKADCTTGYMNVAVSTSTDPTKSWIRFRISMGDAWSDHIRIGVSDNKVVLATDRWDLDDEAVNCLGEPFEGSRLRVADWSDLLNGGSVTSRDVSPSSSTNYFALAPATNVPTSTSATSSTTIYIAGDKFASGTWGNVVLMTITGSAKSGSAKLARNENLTSSGEVSLLNGPPAAIAAFSSGNGSQDERVVSATYRSGKLYFSSTGTCQLQEDTDPRACARFTLLNTSVTPATEVESVYLTDIARDTFLPLIGFSRDGGAYFTMAASSALATEPIDQLATYRASGQSLATGDLEVPILEGTDVINDSYFGQVGSVMAVPNDARAVLAAYSGVSDREREEQHWGTWTTQLRGGQSGDPGGTLSVQGSGFSGDFARSSFLQLVPRPSASSPVRLFRYSASPTVEDTAGGPRLVTGKDVVSLSDLWDDFSSAELGGTSGGETITAYGQWQTWDGTWSTPVSRTLTFDLVGPALTNLKVSFGSGTVGTSAPMKWTWAASDAMSGVGFVQYFEERSTPSPHAQFFADLPATATSYTRSLHVSSTYRYETHIFAVDKVDNTTDGELSVSISNVPTSANITFAKTWSTSTNSKYLGGSTKYATAKSATVTYAFTGRAIAFISTKSPSRGKAEIWIDGAKVSTIDLKASSTKYRQIAFQTSWSTVGPHTIMVKVLGTSGRPRVDFDSFLKAD